MRNNCGLKRKTRRLGPLQTPAPGDSADTFWLGGVVASVLDS